ncbi:acyltransferase-like protein At1g54570, chloroplastic isoform X1 [Papaver somniferum]|uniref:acyltransferase-like protein At1g54570, chloroplastic isoform X1 n=1 Tax=Papaver somniferum TaxID=3469 RepID=UPI000E7031B1|nr:acyltransferase-like protein At1g54570, chloroplastic isoform X1 [Papaver somniferum]
MAGIVANTMMLKSISAPWKLNIIRYFNNSSETCTTTLSALYTERNSNYSTERRCRTTMAMSNKQMELKALSLTSSLQSEASVPNKEVYHDQSNQPLTKNFRDYAGGTKDFIRTGGIGEPPRWFSPLECKNQWKNSPLLLYLPGIDGVGLGLISNHQELGKVFDIWCLHIPIEDRTSFKELVQLVEKTVKDEHGRSPSRPIYLVGESIGACLALAVAARNPTIDLLLILANPATSFEKSQLPNLISLLQAIPEQLNIGLVNILTSSTAGDFLRMAMSSVQKQLPVPLSIREATENLSELLSAIPVLADVWTKESVLWKLKMTEAASLYANSRIHAVKAQTLILASGRDQLLPSLEEAQRLSNLLPTCQMRNFNDSGHNLFMEDGFNLVTVIKGAGFYRRSSKIDYVSDYIPQNHSELKKAIDGYGWVNIAADPVMLSTLEDGKIVRGLAGIPSEGPVLFVGYHMLMGFDLAPLMSTFLEQKNILIRGIAHPMFFQNELEKRQLDPSIFDPIKILGAVPVSPTNFYKLLAEKSHVLLYPGGVREAFHGKGEENKLFWPSQSEFVRVASRFGATIIPFGAVGADDLVDIVLDYDDLMKIPYVKDVINELNNGVVQLRTDTDGEIAKQRFYLPGVVPKLPGRFYYLFGKPIETQGRKNELRDKEKAQELYMHTKSEVENSIKYLKEKRETDPYRSLLSRILYQATHDPNSEIPTFEP